MNKKAIIKKEPPEAAPISKPFDTSKLNTDVVNVKSAAVVMPGDEGKSLLESHSGEVFTHTYGSSSPLELEQEETRRATDDSLKNLKSTEKSELDTARFIRALPDDGDGNYQRLPFRKWRTQDIIVICTLFPFMFMMMVTAAVNVYVNIMAVPSPVFLNSEWKAVLLSTLASAGSLVIKMLPSVFERQSHQEMAKRALIALTILLIIYWIILFDGRFDGIGAKPNIAAMLMNDGNSKDHFVLVQILSEMMIAACIFQWITSLMDTYSPTKLIPNPDYPLAVERREQAQKRHQQNLQKLKDAEEALAAYQAAKQGFINEQLAALALAVSRNQSLYE